MLLGMLTFRSWLSLVLNDSKVIACNPICSHLILTHFENQLGILIVRSHTRNSHCCRCIQKHFDTGSVFFLLYNWAYLSHAIKKAKMKKKNGKQHRGRERASERARKIERKITIIYRIYREKRTCEQCCVVSFGCEQLRRLNRKRLKKGKFIKRMKWVSKNSGIRTDEVEYKNFTKYSTKIDKERLLLLWVNGRIYPTF